MQQLPGKVEADLEALYQLDVKLNAYRGDYQDPAYREMVQASRQLYNGLVEVGAIAEEGSCEDDFAGV